ncbi:MAG: tripartite tricarboxylate transporter substrate binding protein [Burkholderiales bacterium]|nr:tripartite tricarboxylate transporter substrate binding protein [Burkholderiales bacterium]
MTSSRHRTAADRLRRVLRGTAVAGACSLASPGAFADYPERPIRLVIPSVPGGATDFIWRSVEPGMAAILGQRLVADNRGGAGGDVGAAIVAQAPADGYTLLGGVASITINAAARKNQSYRLLRDFAPVSLAVKAPNMLLSHPSVPARTVKELIAYVKSQPRPMQFASAGAGSMPHLMMELFLNLTGLTMIHVPYKGTGQIVADVVGGQVPFMMGNILPMLPHVQAGRVRAYGVTSATRSAVAPDIPALAEAGVPGYEAVQWFGMWAPAGTPPALVKKLHHALSQALNEPAFGKRMAGGGAEVAPSASPAAFHEFVLAEIRKWERVARDAKLDLN